MKETPRIRRPRLERTRPDRSWNGPPRDPRSRAGTGGETSRGPGAAPGVVPGVREAVDLGYRVVDAYLRQGQAAARMFGGGEAGYDAWATGVQELGARLLQTTSDVAALWFEMLSASPAAAGFATAMSAPFGAPWAAASTPPAPAPEEAPVAAAPPPQPRAAEPSTGAAPASAPALAIEVQTSRPARVFIDVRNEAWDREWIAHELRTAGGERSRLGARIQTPASAWDPRRIIVEVPHDQAAGTYYGIVVDAETRAPVGVLGVELG